MTTTHRPCQMSLTERLTRAALVVFDATAEEAMPHGDCECCGQQWPTRDLWPITNDDDACRVAGLLEIDPEQDLCPECREALVKDARAATCKCGDPRCNGPRQVDADRWECWTSLYR